MLSGLNNRNVFLIVLGARKSKIKVLTDMVPGEGLLPGLQTATLLLYPHMAERERERDHVFCVSPLFLNFNFNF